MKQISKILIFVMLVLPFSFTGCDDADLPYPLDEVEHGILIHATTAPGTLGFIDPTREPDDYPELGVHFEMVDYGAGEFEKYDIAVVYNNFAEGTMEKIIYQSDITELPYTTDLDYAQILDGFGIEQEQEGDVFFVVLDVTLPSGTVVKGWSEVTGFGNTQFGSWRNNEGESYRARVRYPAACPVFEEEWVGDAYVFNAFLGYEPPNPYIESLEEGDMPEGMENAPLIGFSLHEFYRDGTNGVIRNASMMKFWVNVNTFDVVIPEQGIGQEVNLGALLGEADRWVEFEIRDPYDVELNSCAGILEWKSWMRFDGFWWGGDDEFFVSPMFFYDAVKEQLPDSTIIEHELSKRE